MVDRKDRRFFDFMCSCKEEGRKRCDETYDEVMQSFKDEYENREGRFYREVTDKEFVDLIVDSLDDMENGRANIEHIYTDMWSGVAVRYQYDFQEDLECEDEEGNQVKECKCDKDSDYDCQYTVQDFWIECDRVYHGLARAYQLVKEFDSRAASEKES